MKSEVNPAIDRAEDSTALEVIDVPSQSEKLAELEAAQQLSAHDPSAEKAQEKIQSILAARAEVYVETLLAMGGIDSLQVFLYNFFVLVCILPPYYDVITSTYPGVSHGFQLPVRGHWGSSMKLLKYGDVRQVRGREAVYGLMSDESLYLLTLLFEWHAWNAVSRTACFAATGSQLASFWQCSWPLTPLLQSPA